MYTDIGTVKSYLGNVLPTVDDAILIDFIMAAQQQIDNHWHQVYEAATDTTRYIDPRRHVEGRRLWLDYPLCAITSVTNGDGVVVAPSAYVTQELNQTPYWALTLKSSSGVAWTGGTDGENAIAIEGRWAYSITADAIIQQAATRLAGYLYRQRDNGFDLDRAIQTQNGVVTPFGLPVDIKELLAPYKRYAV